MTEEFRDDRKFPIGEKIKLLGHFSDLVILESVRDLGNGFECRVRLSNGTDLPPVVAPPTELGSQVF
jgi:hypothetical protein